MSPRDPVIFQGLTRVGARRALRFTDTADVAWTITDVPSAATIDVQGFARGLEREVTMLADAPEIILDQTGQKYDPIRVLAPDGTTPSIKFGRGTLLWQFRHSGNDLELLDTNSNVRMVIANGGTTTFFTVDINSILSFTKQATLASYTVIGLPSGSAGQVAYASNGRKAGEGVGAGTGVLVFHDGSNWIACDTGATVAA